jgi:ABC-type transport system substrate-binding protein
MNPRRITLTLGTAAGTAVAAALIGLANAPAATADTDLDPLEDLLGSTGFNSWTPTADTDLGALAGGFDTSVDNFSAANVDPFLIPDTDPISSGLYSFDPSAFTADPGLGGLPDNGIGDLAMGLDYTLFSAETEVTQLFSPLITLTLELLGFPSFL